MRALFGLVLLVGLALAGSAVYMVNQYMDDQARLLQNERAKVRAAIQTVDVYSPARDLTYGELLTIEDVKLIKYARDYLPEGIFLTEEELFPDGTDVHRVVLLPVKVNEPLLADNLSEPGASRGLTALVQPGMRAFPISGRVAAGFGILRPGDRIDVYWTGQLQSGREVTNLIRSGLEIIAVLTAEQNTAGAPQSVVVQVSPEEVALLTQAENSGRLTLSLVGAGDVTETGPVTIDNRALTGEVDEVVVEEAPEPVVEEERCYVTQRSGTQRVRVEIDCAN